MSGAANIIVKAVVAVGVTILTGGTATAAFIAGAGSLILGFVSQALAPKPPSPDFGSFGAISSERTQTLRQAITHRRKGAGTVVLGTVLTGYYTTENKKYHHMIMTVCDGPIDSFGTIWVNDEPINPEDIDNDGNVTQGRFANRLRLKLHLGSTTQQADSDLLNEVTSLDSNHRGRGVAYIYARVQWNRNILPNGLPAFRAAVNAEVTDPRTSTTGFNDNAALAWRDYVIDEELGLGAHSATAADINSTAFTSAANVCDEIADTNNKAATVEGVDTSGDTLALTDERCPFFTGDRVSASNDNSPADLPSGLSEGTDYYVIVVNHARASSDSPVRIKLATSLANARAGTAITLSDAGTGTHTITKDGEPRYRASGMVDTKAEPAQIIEDLLSSMVGTASYTGGQWVLLPGSWRSGSIVYDEDDLRGPVSGPTRYPKDERYNRIRGIYASPYNDGEATEYPVVTSSTLLSADNSKPEWDTFDQAFTAQPTQAQRNAGQRLKRYRTGEVRFDTTFSFRAIQNKVGDVILLTNERRGWTQKAMEIRAMSLAVDRGDDGTPVLVCPVSLAATLETDFDWDPATEETDVNPSPRLTGTGVFSVEPPTGLMIQSGNDQLFVDTDGTVIPRMQISWTASVDGLIDRYVLKYRKSGDTNPTELTLGPGSVDHWVAPVQSGDVYSVTLTAYNLLGVASDDVTDSHVVLGKSAKPDDMGTFFVTQDADGTRRFTGTYPDKPADFAGYRIKHTTGTADWDNDAELLDDGGLIPSLPYETNELAAGTYEISIRPVDTSGNEAANSLVTQVTFGDPRLRNAILTRNEYTLEWPGTLTDCFVNYEGYLEAAATSNGTWDALGGSPGATWGSLTTSWYADIPRENPAVYETPVIDVGGNLTFTVLVTVQGTGTATVTYAFGAEGDSPQVGAYGSDNQATAKRYVQIKVSMSDGTCAVIENVRIILDGESLTDSFEDVDTSSETESWFSSVATGHFKIATRKSDMAFISRAEITALQNVGPGWDWELISKSTTVTSGGNPAAEFKVYNSSGALADATVDVLLTGPKSGS